MAQQKTRAVGVSRARVGTITAIAGVALSASAWGQIGNPEVEPNDTKGAATVANSGGAGLMAGDFLTGNTTGSSTTTPGPASADYFRVTVKTAPLAIYRHRLTITTGGTSGHTGTIRGLSQGSTGIGATDSSMGDSSSATGRLNQWYGFGKGEEFFYRVAGVAGTTDDYTSTMSTDPVTLNADITGVGPGSLTITAVGQGHSTDTDFWVFDSNLNPIPDFGNDDQLGVGVGPGQVTRAVSSGTFYVAMSNYNLATNLATPSDDNWRTGPVLDFPNLVTQSSTSTGLNVSFALVSTTGTTPVPATKVGAFDVSWTRFQVAAPNVPVGVGTANPNPVGPGDTVNFSVVVTPVGGPNPSTGLAVSLDATQLGGGTLALTDPDSDLTFTGSFVVGPNATGGQLQLPYTVSDAQNRSSTSAVALRVNAPPSFTDLGTITTANQGTLVSAVDVGAGQVKWYRFSIPAEAASPNFLEITSNGSSADTEIGVYSPAGTLVDNDDDDGVLAASALSWGAGSGTQIGGTGTGDTVPITGTGQDGTLGVGSYFLAVARFNVAFGTTNFTVTTSSTEAVSVNLNFATNIPGGPTCDGIDFNGDGVFPDLTDIVDFFFVYGGGDCPTGTCNDTDFNNDGVFPDLADVIKFLDVYGGGVC
jgi:hypothetical protein